MAHSVAVDWYIITGAEAWSLGFYWKPLLHRYRRRGKGFCGHCWRHIVRYQSLLIILLEDRHADHFNLSRESLELATRWNGRAAGYAFAVWSTASEAEAAVQALDTKSRLFFSLLTYRLRSLSAISSCE
jgi:hypothetical protein